MNIVIKITKQRSIDEVIKDASINFKKNRNKVKSYKSN